MSTPLNCRTERGRNEPLNNCTSLDKPIEGQDGEISTLMDLVKDEAIDFVRQFENASEAECIRAAVNTLPEPQRSVIQTHYFEGKRFQEIAEHLSVSREMAVKLHKEALKNLRKNQLLRTIYRLHS